MRLRSAILVAFVPLVTLVLVPLAAEAQQARKMPKIALVFGNTPEAQMTGPQPTDPYARAFLEGMNELGWVDGRNITIVRKSSEGHPDRRLALAQELVSLKVNLMVVSGNALLEPVRHLTDTIPIVFVAIGDPIGLGIVKSLGRPGGNVTGLTTAASPALLGKQLELLKEAVPKTSRVAYLADVQVPPPDAAARALSLTLVPVYVDAPDGLQTAFATIRRDRVDAVFVVAGSFLWANRRTIIEFAAKQRLPVIYPFDIYVRDGGLMSYGADLHDLFRRAATYVDKILKGAKPGDLPIEQPTKFDLLINLRTAKVLDLTIPQSLLLRADHVIELE
jgi:putative tryptophan/tyrosine transport system substrate-binding protein